MPAIHAHDRFGQIVISTLPLSIRKKLLAYPSALRLGFQGPDVLFYHKPLKKNKNPEREKGVAMHHELADAFFIEQAKRLVKEGNTLTPSPELSYIGGFLCHYLLDYHLHPTVYKTQKTGVSHGRIESEFDKFLFEKDGLPYRGINPAKAYLKGAGTSRAVANVLDVKEKEGKKAIKTMKKINGLFACRCQFVHAICHGALSLVGMDKKFGDMFRRKKNHPECDKANEQLFKLMEDCSIKCMRLVRTYFDNLEEIATTEKMDVIFHENYTGGAF